MKVNLWHITSRVLAISLVAAVMTGCSCFNPKAPKAEQFVELPKLIVQLKKSLREAEEASKREGPCMFAFVSPVSLELTTVVSREATGGVSPIGVVPIEAKGKISSEKTQKLCLQFKPILLGSGKTQTTATFKLPDGKNTTTVTLIDADLVTVGEKTYLVGCEPKNAKQEVWRPISDLIDIRSEAIPEGTK